MTDSLPIFAICGWSGSGKTTLLEQIIPPLTARGLSVALVKHDAHGIDIDRPGKDSDRLYRAGADILLQGPDQEFLRRHRTPQSDWTKVLTPLAERYDLVLVEGHKTASLPKVWLLADEQTDPPDDIRNIQAVLSRDCDRPAAVGPLLDRFISDQWLKTPVYGCVMIGGKSRRMGSPKHLLMQDGQSWLARTIELLRPLCEHVAVAGTGELPPDAAGITRLADSPDAEGPIAGLLAAMRWAPHVSWLVAACDLPDLSTDAMEWLVSTRRPGVWATLPTQAGASTCEPLLAHYDFRCLSVLQQQAAGGNYRMSQLASHPKVISPEIPTHLAGSWSNVNSPADRPQD